MAPPEPNAPVSVDEWFTRGAGGAVIKLAATEAAKSAMAETFALVGVDVHDATSVREFRDGIAHAVAAKKAQNARADAWHRGVVNSAYTLSIAAIIGLVSVFAGFFRVSLGTH